MNLHAIMYINEKGPDTCLGPFGTMLANGRPT